MGDVGYVGNVRKVGNVRRSSRSVVPHVPSFLTYPTFLTFLAFLACSCSSEKTEPAADWRRVPVSIELHLAEGSPGSGLEPRTVYGQGKKVYLHPKAELSNRDIARVEALQTRIGQGVVLQVWHTKAGARRIADLTSHHIGDSLAILINSVVVAVPMIRDTLNPGTRMSTDIGVPLQPKEAGQLAQAVSKTWPERRNGRTGGT